MTEWKFIAWNDKISLEMTAKKDFEALAKRIDKNIQPHMN